MNIPINFGFWFAAILPILFLFISITGLNWSASKAALSGVLLSGCIALLIYRANIQGLLSESAKGLWNALTILLVIWPAIFIYELTDESKGFLAIRNGIQSLTKHELLQIMIMGWIFPDFLQGITGFGVAVAVGAPLLVNIGVKPLWSVVIVLLCYSWGATFGTLALAWDALLTQAGIIGDAAQLTARMSAAFIGVFILIAALYLCWVYGKWKAIKEGLPIVLPLVFIQAGGQFLLAPINATISCFLPTTIALLAVVIIARQKRFNREWKIIDSPIMERNSLVKEEQSQMSFHQGFLPYYVLTLVTIICLLIPSINQFLGQWKIGFSFPEISTGYGYITPAERFFSPLTPLTYAGTILAEACLISIIYYKSKRLIREGGLKRIWKRTVKKALPSTIAITGFIVMAKIMSSSGQIYVLSHGIVNVLGKSYILAAPLLGIVGAFITSSNMSSNILLGEFQMTAAQLLEISPAVILSLQTFGGAVGSAIAPGSIILGISTTSMEGAEGSILKKVMPISLGCGIVAGVFALMFLV